MFCWCVSFTDSNMNPQIQTIIASKEGSLLSLLPCIDKTGVLPCHLSPLMPTIVASCRRNIKKQAIPKPLGTSRKEIYKFNWTFMFYISNNWMSKLRQEWARIVYPSYWLSLPQLVSLLLSSYRLETGEPLEIRNLRFIFSPPSLHARLNTVPCIKVPTRWW